MKKLRPGGRESVSKITQRVGGIPGSHRKPEYLQNAVISFFLIKEIFFVTSFFIVVQI